MNKTKSNKKRTGLIIGSLTILIFVGCAAFAWKKKTASKDVVVPFLNEYTGTEGMIKYLQLEWQKVNVMDNKFANDFRLNKFLNTPMPKDPPKALQLKGSIAREYLSSGKSEEAIEAFKEYMRYAEEHNLRPEDYMYVKHMYAMAAMRTGEIQNCYQNHNAESCIFPIQGNGVHIDKTASQKAIDI